MTFRIKTFLCLFFLLVFPAQVASQTLEEAREFYSSGQFEKAVEVGNALGTLEGLQIAIRSKAIMVQYTLAPEDRLEFLAGAIPEAIAAREKYPEDRELMLSAGILIGLRGRYEKSISDGKEARVLFEKALEKAPNDPLALGALGSWHAETVHQAGGIAARLVMGAKKKFAYNYFEKSLEADPNNIVIKAAFIRALLKLKPKEYAGVLIGLVKDVKTAKPKDALEVLLQAQIRRIDAAKDAGDDETYDLLLSESVSLKDALE